MEPSTEPRNGCIRPALESTALSRARGLERAAVFSVAIISRRESSRYCFNPNFGLAITDTAPAANASSATLLPSVDNVEQITVGMGCVAMI